ncbi:MAG: Crp/Fnr family transcriptional regulator [Chloroflexota bacterium]|nr:MAG: Crp/Fnr family transcriptional regulator [Chloroflexota bacterium]
MPHDILPGLRRVLDRAKSKPPTVQGQLPYKREYLRQIDIFRDLSTEEMHTLDAMTRMTTVPKGRTIYHQEEHAAGLFLLKKGRVRLSRTSPSGKKLDLAVLEPGTFFGEMPLLGEHMRNADAEALEDCTLCVMSQADVERLLLNKPQVALRMLGILGRRLAESEARLEDLAYRSLPARLASLLLRLGENSGDVIEGVTHQELGDMLGVYRETITKTLDEFQDAGYIELARRRIRILDRAELSGQLHE